MWAYIVRRLAIMVVTVFGITVISFCVMQLAPGDPALSQTGGGAGNTESRDVYLQRKRDLHLDKPLVFNFRYFHDYSRDMRLAAYYMGRSPDQIRRDLPKLEAAQSNPAADPSAADRLRFLKSLGIPNFDAWLKNHQHWKSLAASIGSYVQVFCEDTGANGVPAAIAILEDKSAGRELQIGAVRALSSMVPEPFVFTYSAQPVEAETPAVTGAWKLWWDRHQQQYAKPDAEATKYLDDSLARMVEAAGQAGRKSEYFKIVSQVADSEYRPFAVHYFAEKLLGDSPLDVKAAAAGALIAFVPAPLTMGIDSFAIGAARLAEAKANWLEHYEIHKSEYEPTTATRLWNIVADTQYAHMVWRLVTFNFGLSALRTRDRVSDRMWSAFLVSAPLMLASEFLIYALAVPLGIFCGVTRGRWTDHTISIGLFLLNSIPPFIAAMLFLVFFCYGDYLKWFPIAGLHSENAADLSFLPYLWDYLWHAFLPIVCLSLFSLAAMAMYSRSAILDVISQDYIRTARAKGLSRRTVIFKHALRNALIPIITLFASFLPAMLGGSVLIEYLFDIPGMGRLGWSSIEQKDFPMLMALLYVEAIVTLLSILLSDLLYLFVDPRISFEGRGASA